MLALAVLRRSLVLSYQSCHVMSCHVMSCQLAACGTVELCPPSDHDELAVTCW
jgi:hypothetical protein